MTTAGGHLASARFGDAHVGQTPRTGMHHLGPRAPGGRMSGLHARPQYRQRAQYGHALSRRAWTAAKSATLGRTAFNVAVLGLLGWVLVWFFASDQFYVRQIAVVGNRRLSADVIRQASGLQGYSIFWIHPGQVAAQVMKSLPPLTSVQVRHSLSNTVTVSVKEQEDQIMWQVSGVRYWVDEDGSLRPVQADGVPPPEGQPLAADWVPTDDWMLLVKDVRPNLDAASAGTLSIEPEALVAARQVVRLLPEVRVVEYAPTIGLRFLHPRGWWVYLGAGSEMPLKVNVLRAMEVQFAAKDALQPTLIDLRYPDSPYYRLPEDAPSGSEGG